MLKLTITWGQTTYDYTKYLWSQQGQDGQMPTLQINEELNLPSKMSFSLVPVDAQFKIPPQRAYVRFYSTQYDRSLFTGFISTEPVRKYMAPAPRNYDPTEQPGQFYTPSNPKPNFAKIPTQFFQYDIQCVSDELLLNMKSVPFIPAFINRGGGQILSSLADILCPGYFDTSLVTSGDLVPNLPYNPAKSWSELAKEQADGCRFRYKARDKQIFYQPYGDGPLGIEYDESKSRQMFDPRALDTTVLSVPLVNDITVIGDVEAGNNREDYFLGDGFTADFPLLHKVFRGSSTLLLQESWSEHNFNAQQWFVQDPGNNFDLSVGTLNILTPVGSPFAQGQSVIAMNNGIELAGGIDLEHGEFTFNDTSTGLVGCVYPDATYIDPMGGFLISAPGSVIQPPPGPSGFGGLGVGGLTIQPFWEADGIGDAIVTKVNHTYVLQTVIVAPQYSRYDRIYRTIEGQEFGGGENETTGSVTFTVQEFDVFAATGIYYTPKLYQVTKNNIPMPAFAAYAVVNNYALNCTIVNTTIANMPLGALSALEGPCGLFMPTGSILPMLPPLSGGYIGPVLPWPNSATATLFPPPLPLAHDSSHLVLGNGLELQTAQITQGNEADKLDFYAQTIPAAGTPIRLQSWEAQAAVSRIQDELSIKNEAFIVGDDGIRSAIVSDLNPLPRTSEDADNAALAFLKDRVGTFYNGTYECTSLFFTPLTSDKQFYPTVGRYFNVNAPRRGIVQQKYLVTSLTITVKDLVTELLDFQLSFGADLQLEKVLKNFVDLAPVGVLTPKDTANPPNPRFSQNVTSTYLPDLTDVQADMRYITDSGVTIHVYDNYFGPIEVRKVDANWGKGKTFDYIGTYYGPEFALDRRQVDQVWYMRPNQNGVLSRRSKVIRVFYPTKPLHPLFVGATPVSAPINSSGTLFDTFIMQFNWNGDQRNIYGIELRAADDKTILVQKPVNSYADLSLDLSQTSFPFLGDPLNIDYNLFARFFNRQWVYSTPFITEAFAESLLTQGEPYPWTPDYAVPITGDAIYKANQFGVQIAFEPDVDGNTITSALLKGLPPPSDLSELVGPPVITATLIPGGTLPGGTYQIACCAFDADPSTTDYHCTGLSDFETVHVPMSGFGAIQVDIFDWDTGSFGGDVFMSTPSFTGNWYQQARLPKDVLSYSISGFNQSSFGAPDILFDHLGLEYQEEVHGGIWAAQVDAVASGSLTFWRQSFTTNQFVGRIVTVLGHINALFELEVVNLVVTSNDATTLHFNTPVDLTTVVAQYDVVMMRMLPTNITALSFEDPLLVNSFAPLGMTPGVEAGTLAVVLAGPGAGQINPISDNTATKFTLATPWAVMPTSGSLIVTINTATFAEYDSPPFLARNSDGVPITLEQNLTSLAGLVWLFKIWTEDINGVRAATAPFRELYVFKFQENSDLVPRPWAPFTIQANAPGGQVMHTANGIGIQQQYTLDANDNNLASFLINGYCIPNQLSKKTTAPQIVSITADPAGGGFITGGKTVTVGVFAFDAAGLSTDITLGAIRIPAGSDTNVLNVKVILGDPVNDSPVIMVGDFVESGLYEKSAYPAGSTDLQLFNDVPIGHNGPDPKFDHFVLRAKREFHGGIWGGPIVAISSASGTLITIGGTWTPHQLQGRVMSLVSKADNSPMHVVDLPIVDNDGTSFTLAQDITHVAATGDIILIRTAPTSATANSVEDTGWVNGGAGQLGIGLEPDQDVGQLYWIIWGTGRGQVRTITTNSASGHVVATPWDIIPDSTSIGIIVEQAWSTPVESHTAPATIAQGIEMELQVDNTNNQVYVVQVLTADAFGNTSMEEWSPFREIFQKGLSGVNGGEGVYTFDAGTPY